MEKKVLKDRYFRWIYRMMCFRWGGGRSWVKLFRELSAIDYTYSLEMDRNRGADGVDFRYRFGYEEGYPGDDIAAYLDDRPCSMLEMMAALAHRCEEQIMWDPTKEDRTGKWFFTMIASLGLDGMHDGCFDKELVHRRVNRFLDRDYAKNGLGGLFVTKDRTVDMRDMEIWYQMMKYLNDISDGGDDIWPD